MHQRRPPPVPSRSSKVSREAEFSPQNDPPPSRETGDPLENCPTTTYVRPAAAPPTATSSTPRATYLHTPSIRVAPRAGQRVDIDDEAAPPRWSLERKLLAANILLGVVALLEFLLF